MRHISTQDTLACEHETRQSTLACEHVSTQGTLASEHKSTQDTLAREYVRTQGMVARQHVSTQGTLAHEHETTQSTLARKQRSTQDTLAREHVFSRQGTEFSRFFKILVSENKSSHLNDKNGENQADLEKIESLLMTDEKFNSSRITKSPLKIINNTSIVSTQC